VAEGLYKLLFINLLFLMFSLWLPDCPTIVVLLLLLVAIYGLVQVGGWFFFEATFYALIICDPPARLSIDFLKFLAGGDVVVACYPLVSIP